MSKKGFIMIEVVVVAVVIFIISITLYVSTKNVLSKSEMIEKYDSAENIYNLNTIKVFLYRNYDVNTLCDYVLNNDTLEHKIFPLVSISSSKEIYNLDLDEENLKKFKKLTKEMGIKTLLFTNYSGITTGTDETTSKVKTDTNLNKYIEYIDNKKTNQLLYLLIAEFNDGTFASINMYKISEESYE